MREPQKVERFRSAKTAFGAFVRRVVSERKEARLVRVQRQFERRQPLCHLCPEPLGIAFVLESDDDVNTTDYDIRSYGGLVGLDDRLEISWSHQDFDTEAVGAALGLGHGYTIGQDVLGVKVKVLGDAVLEQDTWLPQVAVGIQFKKNQNGALVKALGARDDEGTDYYVSATKLFLAKGLLVNGTVRATKANQFGILGFGGIDDDYHYQFEGSVAYLLTRKLAIGAEVRTKPDNLAVAKEDAAFDVFVAYAPVKHISVTLAYADLGNIVTRRQTGLYASLQVGF